MFYSLINQLNFKRYSLDELISIAKDFSKQARDKIENKPSSLLMASSFLKKSLPKSAFPDILSMDFGGSNLRLGIFSYDPQIQRLSLKPDTKFNVIELQGSKYSLDGLMTTISDSILNYLGETKTPGITHMGFTFSFPAQIIKVGEHFDAVRNEMDEDWGKGFFVSGSKTNISKVLREKLQKAGLNLKKMITVNDVSALLFCDPQALLSVIVGTGYNIGVLLADKTLCNSETKFFTSQFLIDTLTKPAQLLLNEMQEEYQNIYQSLENFIPLYTEIQVGGGYLYKLLILSLCFCGETNLNLVKAITSKESAAVSLILEKKFQQLANGQISTLSPQEQKILLKIVQEIVWRSSDLVATQLAGALLFEQEQGLKDSPLTIAADGSVIRYLPGFKEQVQSKLKEILLAIKLPNADSVNIKLLENTGLWGAAYGVLGNQ